jgi:hypothetical protein
MIERPEKARIPCFLGRGPNKSKALETLVKRTEISMISIHIGTSCTISPQIWWLVGPGGISRQGRRHRRPFVAAQAVPTRFCSAKMVSSRARDLRGARDAMCDDGVSSRARFSGDDRRCEEKPFARARSRCTPGSSRGWRDPRRVDAVAMRRAVTVVSTQTTRAFAAGSTRPRSAPRALSGLASRDAPDAPRGHPAWGLARGWTRRDDPLARPASLGAFAPVVRCSPRVVSPIHRATPPQRPRTVPASRFSRS